VAGLYLPLHLFESRLLDQGAETLRGMRSAVPAVDTAALRAGLVETRAALFARLDG
jgi:hypothetical protein